MEASDASDLCPGTGPVTGALPSGVTVFYDTKQGSNGIDQLAATDAVIVWGNSSMIGRVDTADGSSTTVIDRSSDTVDYTVGWFAIDDQFVYFADTALTGHPSLGLAKFPLSGSGAPTTIVASANVGLIAVSGGYIYYEDVDPTTGNSAIVRIPAGGGTSTRVLDGILGGARGLAVGGGYVYFMSTIGVGSYSSLYVARVPIGAQAQSSDGGANAGTGDAGVAPAGAELVATTGLHAYGPVLDGTNVYWGDEDKLMAAPLTGGSPVMLAQAEPIGGPLPMTADIRAIASQAGWVYWSSFACQALRKTPASGGMTTTVVPSISAAPIAANGSHVFFTPANGQILSGPL